VHGIPLRETLDIWPLFPIVVYGYEDWDEDGDMVAALEHNNRTCSIDLVCIPSFRLEKVLAATQQPFPALTSLVLGLEESDVPVTVPIAPDLLLGESAPRLQKNSG
jgi:hypothetical protein